jgi:tight adherence protein C
MISTSTFFIILGGVVVVGAIILVIIGLRNPGVSEDLMQDRLDEFIQTGEQISLESLEMSQPITERIIFPIARALGGLVLRFTPQAALESTRKRLEMSGLAARIEPTILLAGQIVLAVGLAILMFVVFSSSKGTILQTLMYAAGAAALGYYVPILYVQSKVNSRQKGIRKSMPDALDLLTVCVEAGLGFDAAMAKVAEKWETELSLAFKRVNREVQIGKPRREALRDMAERLGVAELTSFVAAIIQSETLGVPMGKVLRIQSDQMRVIRRQNAERAAHQAPTKMVFPMVLLIFPALIIILITPAILQLANLLINP